MHPQHPRRYGRTCGSSSPDGRGAGEAGHRTGSTRRSPAGPVAESGDFAARNNKTAAKLTAPRQSRPKTRRPMANMKAASRPMAHRMVPSSARTARNVGALRRQRFSAHVVRGPPSGGEFATIGTGRVALAMFTMATAGASSSASIAQRGDGGVSVEGVGVHCRRPLPAVKAGFAARNKTAVEGRNPDQADCHADNAFHGSATLAIGARQHRTALTASIGPHGGETSAFAPRSP